MVRAPYASWPNLRDKLYIPNHLLSNAIIHFTNIYNFSLFILYAIFRVKIPLNNYHIIFVSYFHKTVSI